MSYSRSFPGNFSSKFNQLSSSTGDFPDPFLDMASLMMPSSLKNVLDLCEAMWLKNGVYRMAAGRIVRYFITDIDTPSDVDDNFVDFYKRRFNINEKLMLLGDDFLCYGNSISSVYTPFRRFLKCSKCGLERLIDNIGEWSYKEFEFFARCPACKANLKHDRIDKKSTERDKIALIRWPLNEIKIKYHRISQDREYYWNIPTKFINEISSGNQFFVKSTPVEILECVKQRKPFKFFDGIIHHMREDTVCGVDSGGWGVSRLLSNFAQGWYVQILKRYNEALALDYSVPFRLVTPARGRLEDPLLRVGTGEFKNKFSQIVREHRQDPASWHVLPFPVDYQALSGEAKDLTTPELLNQGMDELLNSIGIPAELYKGTLQFQAAPTALRLFQQTWPQLIGAFNDFIEFSTTVICNYMNWPRPEKVKLKPVTMADDIEMRQVWLQLASANMISKQTAFSPWNIDAKEETERALKEQVESSKLMQEVQEDMMQKQMLSDQVSGNMPPGAMPAGAGPMGAGAAMPSAAMTPQDLQGQAQEIAQQLVTMPYSARRSEMQNIKNTNQTLHALVKANMEQIRGDAELQGKLALQGGM